MMRNWTLLFWTSYRSVPGVSVAQTNVWRVPPGLEVSDVVPSPPVPGAAVSQVEPPSMLYWTWMLQGSESGSVNV